MECMAVEPVHFLFIEMGEFGQKTTGFCQAAAIGLIPKDGKTHVGSMNPYLMGPSCFWKKRDQG